MKNLQGHIESDAINSIPICNEGCLKGVSHLGKVCKACGTEVRSPFDKIDPTLWMEKPSSIKGFISPFFWTMLYKTLSSDASDPVLYMLNSEYVPPKEGAVIQAIKGFPGFKRDYNYGIENLENILIYLSLLPTFNKFNRQSELQRCIKLWQLEKHNLLTRYIPLVASRLFVKEKTSKGSFTSLLSGEVLTTALTFVSNIKNYVTDTEAGNVTSLVIHQLSKIYTETLNKVLVKKEGAFRQHIYSSKLPFTFRGVIVAKTTGRHDGLEMPYSMMVVLLQPMIINRLRKGSVTRKPMKARDATSKFFSAIKCFDSEIYDIMNQLNSESYTGALRVIFLRNPVLHITSLMYMFVESIKKDVNDTTIGYHLLATSGSNADYDGKNDFGTL